MIVVMVMVMAMALWVGAATPENNPEGGGHTATPSEALEALRERADGGDVEAMNYLGYLLLSGNDSIERDTPEGLKWLTRAAAAGDVKAASNIGWLLIQGDIVEQDLEEGIGWLRKAADAGLPVAQSLLGDLYRDGNGVATDTLAADSLYRKAFEGGLADAGYKLYDLNSARYAAMSPQEKVEEGKYYYIRYAPSEGVKLFYQAADEGDADALALLGDAYTRAIGVPYDYNLSLRYYVKAAEAGNPSAQFVIGELLEIFPDGLDSFRNADGTPLSDDPAYWFEKAAAQGVSDALTATRRLLGD